MPVSGALQDPTTLPNTFSVTAWSPLESPWWSGAKVNFTATCTNVNGTSLRSAPFEFLYRTACSSARFPRSPRMMQQVLCCAVRSGSAGQAGALHLGLRPKLRGGHAVPAGPGARTFVVASLHEWDLTGSAVVPCCLVLGCGVAGRTAGVRQLHGDVVSKHGRLERVHGGACACRVFTRVCAACVTGS